MDIRSFFLSDTSISNQVESGVTSFTDIGVITVPAVINITFKAFPPSGIGRGPISINILTFITHISGDTGSTVVNVTGKTVGSGWVGLDGVGSGGSSANLASGGR